MPNVTLDMLREKIAQVEKQQEELIARLNAVAGAKQVLEALIVEVQADPAPKD